MGTAFHWQGTSGDGIKTANWGLPVHDIVQIFAGSKTVKISGEHAADFLTKLVIAGTTQDGTLTVDGGTPPSQGGGFTYVVVTDALSDETPVGATASPCPRWPGDDDADGADTVDIIGPTPPSESFSTAFPGGLTVAAYTCSGSNYTSGSALTVTDTVTIGSAPVGGVVGTDAPLFDGTATGATCVAQAAAQFMGVGGDWTISDNAIINGGSPETVAGTFNVTGGWDIRGGDYSSSTMTFTGNPARFDDSNAALVLPATVDVAAADVVLTGGLGLGITGGPNFRLTSDTASIQFVDVTTIDPKVVTNAGANRDTADQATLEAQKTKLLRPADGGPANIQFGSATATVGTATLPAAANVWTGTGTYGVGGTGTTPSKNASSITNCTAANIKDGVAIGDVTGTYSPAGLADMAPSLSLI